MSQLDDLMRDCAQETDSRRALELFMRGVSNHLQDMLRHGRFDLMQYHVRSYMTELNDKVPALADAVFVNTEVDQEIQDELVERMQELGDDVEAASGRLSDAADER